MSNFDNELDRNEMLRKLSELKEEYEYLQLKFKILDEMKSKEYIKILEKSVNSTVEDLKSEELELNEKISQLELILGDTENLDNIEVSERQDDADVYQEPLNDKFLFDSAYENDGYSIEVMIYNKNVVTVFNNKFS